MLRRFVKKKETKAGSVDSSAFPRHIAIIMDGNGRWAQQRGLPRTAGHSAGAEVFRKLVYYCRDIGLEYLTVYAFSTENWKRPEDEVSAIMKLLEKYLVEASEKIERDKIRLRLIGDMSVMSERIRSLVAETEKKSANVFDGLVVNLCVNYGGRDDILQAADKCAQMLKSGEISEITEDTFKKCTYFGDIPDPDLIIRPGGELRISNFMLWQCAYAEFYYPDILWPDFNTDELDKAIAVFASRNRRFGGVDSEKGEEEK